MAKQDWAAQKTIRSVVPSFANVSIVFLACFIFETLATRPSDERVFWISSEQRPALVFEPHRGGPWTFPD